METVLITLGGPLRRVDVEAPVGVPIAELMPALLEACDIASSGPHGPAATGWLLGAPEAGQPFPQSATLEQCGVFDGTYLVVRGTQEWMMAARAQANVPQAGPGTTMPAPESPPVTQYPGGIGIRWRRDALQ